MSLRTFEELKLEERSARKKLIVNAARELDEALSDNYTDAFRRVCRLYICYLNKNIAFLQMMRRFMINGGLPENAQPMLNESVRSVLDRFEKAVGICGLNKKSRFAAHTLFSSLNGVMISYYRNPHKVTKELEKHMRHLTDTLAFLFERWSARMPEKNDRNCKMHTYVKVRGC